MNLRKSGKYVMVGVSFNVKISISLYTIISLTSRLLISKLANRGLVHVDHLMYINWIFITTNNNKHRFTIVNCAKVYYIGKILRSALINSQRKDWTFLLIADSKSNYFSKIPRVTKFAVNKNGKQKSK